MIFTVDENGEITNIKTRAEFPELQKEAIRIVGELPKTEPAMQDGKAISQNYSLPIIFHVGTPKEEKSRMRKAKWKN
ncbi:MAG: energy transducer TonB [Aequorivita sp.]